MLCCVKVSGAGLTDLKAQAPEPFLPVARAESPLAGTDRRASSILLGIPSHSREAEFCCLGLQSYSRRLCLSREKHYRLYP